MRQKFFTKTIQSDFIKSLLYNTPLPLCNCVSLGDYLIKGHTYIYNRSIIKCIKNGYLRPGFKILQVTPQNTLGEFILGYSTLGFRSPITKVSSGSYIIKDKYYLLGQYDLRYRLQEEDPDYQRFDTRSSYSIGDIVIHTDQNKDYLYVAITNIQPGVWNDNQWQFIQSSKEPYDLIKCVDSGYIDKLPLGATYDVVQTFEPETFNIQISSENHDNPYLSGQTYYIIQTGKLSEDQRNWTSQLIYNDFSSYLLDETAEYRTINSYVPETYYRLNTQRYLSAYDYYDSDTHKELGRLLRFYRDVYQVDLLPFYNCWDGSYLDGFLITEDGLVETSSSAVKLIKIPIKFNKKYTIAIDCNSEVKIMPALIKLNDKLSVKLGIGNDIDLCDVLFKLDGMNRYNYLNFNRPVTYDVPNISTASLSTIEGSITLSTTSISEFLQRYENDLYLLIQVPATNTSSVVVLEGDYTHINTINIFNMQYLDKLSFKELNSYLLSDLSLLELNDRVSYPFADRLIEYLLDNVITNRDEIGEDILRIRRKLGNNVVYNPATLSWDIILRKTIYDLYMNTPRTTKLDINGFVDKDVEEFINLS